MAILQLDKDGIFFIQQRLVLLVLNVMHLNKSILLQRYWRMSRIHYLG
jgi:hypothetical protein